jgi:hypothetical protein
LPRKALAGVAAHGGAAAVTRDAVGGEQLAGEQRRAARRIAHGKQDAAQIVSDETGGGLRAALGLQLGDETACQTVVVRAALRVATAVVLVFFEAKGIDGEAGDAPAHGALQTALAGGVVGIPGRIVGVDLPLHHLVERVVGKRLEFAAVGFAVGAARDVAPGIVAQAVVDARRQIAATVALAHWHNSGDLMGRTAVTIEILFVLAVVVQRALP